MSAAVVWVSRGGIADGVSAAGVDLLVIDFQNIEGGDEVPELSPEHRKLLKDQAPQILEDLAAFAPKFVCENCGERFRNEVPLLPIDDIHQRVGVGEPTPAGECPECRCLVHPIEEVPAAILSADWQVPQEDLLRHGLSGRFIVQATAMPAIIRNGLDSVLQWFSQKQVPAIVVGETREIAGTSLKAFFGLDDTASGGDAFFVSIMAGQ